ncbi:WAT1-related protein At1g25270-like isoform X1 [Cucurbita pepo subsp. pepo]|uniref:WAT1-related protein At1g25270-like isoform X1 n=1 Tax=Cucurbita pepo subsp. pepo TaxID=3664 RepID=UPI000C9D9C64|nr:WAT1-related protein At1g25270-like isoform X1 [Cucurbita pepo subsp. pepo]
MNDTVWNALPTIFMVMVQLGLAVGNVLYKLTVADGMNMRIIIAYRFLFASAFMLPLAFFLDRGKRSKLTWSVLFYVFLSAFFGGSLAQNLYLESMSLTSVTFAAAIGNLGPAVTFILALSFRLEKLNITTTGGKAKVVGTLLGIGGAMILTFYKGVELNLWSTHVDLLHNSGGHVADTEHDIRSQLLGSVLGFAGCVSYGLWLIVQAKMSESYPCHYSSTALMCLMASIQAVVFALCLERRWSEWKLGWNVRLLGVSYTGIVASGVTVALISWCVRMRGPMFVSVFSPLILLLLAIAGSLFLEEKLHLGCVIGGVLIICGLYVVLWGKSKEMKKSTQLAPMGSIEHQPVVIDLPISSPTTIPKTETDTPRGSNSSNRNVN